MNTKSKTEFSSYTPEQLSELYKKNPEHFEEIASAALSEACIGRNPAQTIKRRQLQWTIDAQLRKAKTPLERMHIMENIFYSNVFGEEGELAQLMTSCTELVHTLKGTDPVPTLLEADPVPVSKPVLYLVKRSR